MAIDFDNFPLYDPIIQSADLTLSDVWFSFFATFSQTLSEYLSQNGIQVSQLTTAQRNELIGVTGGRLIYNTTDKTLQVYQGDPLTWVNLP